MDTDTHKHNTYKTYILTKHIIIRNSLLCFIKNFYCFPLYFFISNMDIKIHKLITYKTYIHIQTKFIYYSIRNSYGLSQCFFIPNMHMDIHNYNILYKPYIQAKYIATCNSLLFFKGNSCFSNYFFYCVSDIVIHKHYVNKTYKQTKYLLKIMVLLPSLLHILLTGKSKNKYKLNLQFIMYSTVVIHPLSLIIEIRY